MTERQFMAALKDALPGCTITRLRMQMTEEWVLRDRAGDLVERVSIEDFAAVIMDAVHGSPAKRAEDLVLEAIFTRFLKAARRHAGLPPLREPDRKPWWRRALKRVLGRST